MPGAKTEIRREGCACSSVLVAQPAQLRRLPARLCSAPVIWAVLSHALTCRRGPGAFTGSWQLVYIGKLGYGGTRLKTHLHHTPFVSHQQFRYLVTNASQSTHSDATYHNNITSNHQLAMAPEKKMFKKRWLIPLWVVQLIVLGIYLISACVSVSVVDDYDDILDNSRTSSYNADAFM